MKLFPKAVRFGLNMVFATSKKGLLRSKFEKVMYAGCR